MNINKELTNLIVDENNSIRKALNLIQKWLWSLFCKFKE